MSHHALVREHQQAESPSRTRWGPVHVFRSRPGSVTAEALLVWLAGLASAVRRGRSLAVLALLAAVGAVATIVMSELSPGSPPARQAAAHRARTAAAPARAATAQRGAVSRRVSQAGPRPPSSTPAIPTSPSRPAQTVSPAVATRLEASGHDLLHAGHAAAAVPILQRAVAATGERDGACLEPNDQNCLTYAFALYDLGRALRLSGHPTAAVPILERRLRIDNQRAAVAAELVLAVRGVTE
jgi:hypothetical protein